STNNFNSTLQVDRLICYPNDSISFTFEISVTGGQGIYAFNWINPDTLNGKGPITIYLKENLSLKVEISDSLNGKVLFDFQVKKDTIDSLIYDYRNEYIGFYDCTVNYKDSYQNPTVYSTYKDTIEVIKHSNFKKLQISNIQDVDFNFKKLTFWGYHLSGKFQNDSIEFYYYMTAMAMFSYTYNGKKLNK
ncbi:MAG: hypothetical protein MUO72_20400, partial [Bacteroidales bacterium]|nr:hypothetical protein [Bacteroidales bacterium]